MNVLRKGGDTVYVVTLELIKKCNLDCSYCYLGEKEDYKMDFSTAKKAIDLAVHEASKQYDKTLHLYFIGGEPLMAFQMIKKSVAYAEQMCRKAGLVSVYSTTINGTLLNEEIIDFFIEKDFNFKLSLDGFEEVHDRNRQYIKGVGSYQTIYKNLQHIWRFQQETGKIVRAAQVISKNTCNDLTKSLKHLYRLGFQIVESSINTYEEWTDQELEVLFQEVKMAFLYYKKLKQSGDKFYWKFIESRLELFSIAATCFYHCKAGLSSVFVTVNGKLYPCTEVDETVCIGSVHTGLDVKKIREFASIMDSKNEACLSCEEYRYCPATKCIMINYDLYRDFYKPPKAECELTKFLYRLFRAELTSQQKKSLQHFFERSRACQNV